MPIEEPEVDDYSAEDIRKQVARVLRDLGNPEPPVKLGEVRDLLKLDLDYYSKTDLGLFDEVSHRVKVGGKLLLRKPGRMIDAVQKSRAPGAAVSGRPPHSDRRCCADPETPAHRGA